MSWTVVTLAQKSRLDPPPTSSTEGRQSAANVFISGSDPSVAVNLNRLSGRLGAIFNAQRKRSPVIGDFPDHPNPVLVSFSDTVDFSLFSRVADNVQNAGGTVFLSGSGGGSATKTPVKGIVVVSDRSFTAAELNSLVSSANFLIPVLVYKLETPDSVKYEKVTRSGIEVDADGNYFAFDRTPDYGVKTSSASNGNLGGNRTLAQMTFSQRPVGAEALKSALTEQFNKRNGEMKSDAKNGFVSDEPDRLVEFPVIVDARTPVSTIKPLLDAAVGLRVSLLIAIR